METTDGWDTHSEQTQQSILVCILLAAALVLLISGCGAIMYFGRFSWLSDNWIPLACTAFLLAIGWTTTVRFRCS